MLSLIFSIVIVGIIVGLLLWLISFVGAKFSTIPAVFINVATVLVVVVAVIWLITVLWSFVGVSSAPVFKIK